MQDLVAADEQAHVAEEPESVHIERAQRTFKRPFTDEERKTYVEQVTNATLKIRDLRDAKSNSTKGYNERIQAQQGEAITAAEALAAGGVEDYVPCECFWDYNARTYTERTVETGEVVTMRPMSDEEITRFTQRHLPLQGSWLTAGAGFTSAPQEDGDDEEAEEEDGLVDPEDDLEDEDDPDAA